MPRVSRPRSDKAGNRPPDHRFASDNAAGICPEALRAIAAANGGTAPSYGADAVTDAARRAMSRLFERECEVFFVFNGTAANAVALGSLVRSHESIFCHESAHAALDECAAPEFFSGGAKVVGLPGANAKIEPAGFLAALGRGHGVHASKPGVLSLTQATEWGTLYRPAEMRGLVRLARERGMRVHLDGARFANAAAALRVEGWSPADLTWRAGIDVLSFGGTKNGMLLTEAVVFFDRSLARDFDYRVKQGGQLASKMRFAGAQWRAMLSGGAWLRHAAHANRMAARLAEGLARVPGARLLLPVETNAVFAELSPDLASRLQRRWTIHRFIGEHGYRLMCSWATRPEDLREFLRDASRPAPRLSPGPARAR